MCSQHVQYTILRYMANHHAYFLTSAILGSSMSMHTPIHVGLHCVCHVFLYWHGWSGVSACVLQRVYTQYILYHRRSIIYIYICIFRCFFLCILVDCWHISGFGIGSDSFWWRACGTVQKLELMKYFWCRDKVRTVPSLRVVGSGGGRYIICIYIYLCIMTHTIVGVIAQKRPTQQWRHIPTACKLRTVSTAGAADSGPWLYTGNKKHTLNKQRYNDKATRLPHEAVCMALHPTIKPLGLAWLFAWLRSHENEITWLRGCFFSESLFGLFFVQIIFRPIRI